MKDSFDPSHSELAAHGRRDFISRSLLAGGSVLLASETRGKALLTEIDDPDIAKTVGLADSIALYSGLLDDARRFILQKDTELIYVAKYESAEWLARTASDAKRLRSRLAEETALTNQQKQELRTFLSDVEYGGNEIRDGLIRMRQKPLEEIKNLDTDFDRIRDELGTASAALKNGKIDAAKAGITAAINRLKNYGLFSTGTSPAEPATPRPSAPQVQAGVPFRTVPVRSSKLIELLQNVLDLLNSPTTRGGLLHHSNSLNYLRAGQPVFQSIKSVFQNKLKPGTWVQLAIGYAVAFPILLRVSDRNNRLKLLNDALRVVPPGLRDPLLAELAAELANLP
jgi:hypothetical protein